MKNDFSNKAIAALLKSVSAAYEAKNGDKFKIIAYDRAASSIEHASNEIKDLWDEGRLADLPGIGKNIASYLDEFFKTGHVKHFEKVFQGLPPAMFSLLPIPGIGAKTALKLVKELKIDNPKTAIADLKKNGLKGKIRLIPGFGKQSEADILAGIEEYFSRTQRMLLPEADAIAQKIIAWLKEASVIQRIEPLGSLRRMVSTVGDIDIAVATNKPQEAIKHFLRYPGKIRTLEAGETTATILIRGGVHIDLMVQPVSSFGALLQHFTGSKHHNIALREYALQKQYSLSEYGIKSLKEKNKAKRYEFSSEESFYNFLGLAFIPPELREDTGEIEAALRTAQGQPNGLPKLVELEEIRGDLHIHSNFPIETSHDLGEASMEEIVNKARELRYEYVGFCEHNPSISKHSPEQIVNLIRLKKEAVDKLNSSCEKRTNNVFVRSLNGLEIDIRPDGNLAVPPEVFKYLDYAIASIHSSFELSKDKMTSRVLKALANPKIKIFGHPTGRKIGYREGYELDWDKIFSFCLENQKILEINAWPDRLDLPDVLVREAVKRGVKMIINTDSHALYQMDLMRFGVAVARRGWAEKTDIVNTLCYDKIEKLLLDNGK